MVVVKLVDDSHPSTAGTRERILDAALDLFIEKGYDKTPIREVAEGAGITKAALYYHFPGKHEILAALADQLFAGEEELRSWVEQQGVGVEQWERMIEILLDHVLARRKLCLMLDRNRTAFESFLRDESRFESHSRREQLLGEMLNNPSVPLPYRVRFACALSAVFGTVARGDAFTNVPPEELRAEMMAAMRDLLGQVPTQS